MAKAVEHLHGLAPSELAFIKRELHQKLRSNAYVRAMTARPVCALGATAIANYKDGGRNAA